MSRTMIVAVALMASLMLPLSLPAWGEDTPEGWRFHEDVEIQGPYITLAQIAAQVPEEARGTEDFAIWSSPPLGQVYPLTREFLGYRLAQPGGPGKVPVEVLPAVIQVRQKATKLEMTQIEEAYLRHIQSHTTWGGENLQVQVFPVANLPVLPAGGVSLEVSPMVNNRQLGQIVLPIQVWQDGKVMQTLRVAGKVSLRKNVVCAVRPLMPGQIINADDVGMVSREFTSPPQEILADSSMVVGKVLARGVAPNEPISFRDVSQTPPIKPGDKVNILFESGGLTISAKGKAAEPGYLGNSIRVVNLSSKKELQAQVVDKHTVRMTL